MLHKKIDAIAKTLPLNVKVKGSNLYSYNLFALV
jgi:hypothetical protein